MAGMVVGAVVSFGWGMSPLGDTLYEMVPGVIASTLALVIVSLVTPAPPQEVTEEFDRAVAGTRKESAEVS